MAEFFRFRSINGLLGEYQELEKQTIYFASSEELNDPMEGFRDIVWCGDKIVWANFFKEYVFHLHRHYLRFKLKMVTNSTGLEMDNISILDHWNKQAIPLEKSLFDDIWSRFLNIPNMQEFIEALANTKRKIRYREIVYYLREIQSFFLLDEIQKSYIAHRLMSESEMPQLSEELTVPIKEYIDLIRKLEQIEEEQQLNNMFRDFETRHENIGFAERYNTHTSSSGILENNDLLVMFDFPKIYSENLKDLTFPKWWTACFTKSYDNLSVWAKYADSHKGVCLIFEENMNWKPMKYRITEFQKVTYENEPIEINFFRSIGAGTVAEIKETWYKDEKGNISECASHIGDKCEEDTWREDYWNNFFHYITTKNRDWEYEQEHRVILYDIVRGFVEKADHTLTYDFDSLKGIIFGIRTPTEDKMKIIEIIQRKCRKNKRTDFKFFQAYYSAESGDIRKYEIQLPISSTKSID